MPVLQDTRAAVTLAPAKPTGLADLGVPLVDTTTVKKGRVHEHEQLLADGKIGRRYQDLRVIAIKTVEGGLPSAKVFVQFEVFGDNTAMLAGGGVFDIVLFAGERPLSSRTATGLFMPYANFWYPNRFVFEVSLDDFDQADRVDVIAKPEEVGAI
ncbi:hypothetical protein [Xanthobacter agilis]|uniref:Uncharacterized protein n=1 Tax=Xanthobacter agilis TaxID=47492 RepID=A0ABU0LHD2_XANAG|nr:hypothetical protein [Xanthobacter agilis]MDQ0506559.1 hypothetical protein [Xanthobacter agilis]